ncbi:Crp/Fnr family transcriptional regulator [Fluviicola taffensis]|uniref:Putative transcriptional regulator, Crp/Fnr family n=1 Tax=Fluviicola taffensis (strain DSM 16823 / NCIMB 13979 / RW262) TaxID=755732 RepID=F2IIJ4_FLUTR|nr:Crp/Fnr family transcriptional regulator [Fluviicola taffensis]AEA45956.1 putative transcriptional regulator, Crp/Fnr family [Fluviicola taffensis DSM 16823]
MELKSYFECFDIFTSGEIDYAISLFSKRKLNKGDYFIQEGQKCSEVAFVQKGIFRSFYASQSGDEITYCFRFPNELIAAYSSFITGNPSVENLQALSPAELLIIQQKDIDLLVKENPKWVTFLRIIAEQNYLELETRVFQLQRDSAQERYQNMLKKQPQYIQQIPLQYLASYLGITQRHLSRIRKQLVFETNVL